MDIPLLQELLLISALLVLASGLGLVGLRRSHPLQVQRRAGLLPRVHRLGQEFTSLVRRQPPNPGEPYASYLTEAGKSIRLGWERCHKVQADLQRRRPETPAEPIWRLALFIPFYGEIGLRLLEWADLAWLWLQTCRAENEMTQAQQRLNRLAGLGKAELAAVEQLRQNIRTLQTELSGHVMAAALTYERQKLAELAESAAQGAAQLDENEPTPAQVAQVYPERLKIEQELQQVRLALRTHESNRGRLLPRVNQQSERLTAFEQALSAEEARQLAPALRERAQTARQTLTQLTEALNRGDYGNLDASLATTIPQLKEMEDTLKKLANLRNRLSQAQEQTAAALGSLRQWMRQFPPPFLLDVSQEQAKTLQSKLQEQNRAAASEDPAELERVVVVALDEIRKTQVEFERNLAGYERLAAQLSPEAVSGLLKRGENLAARLKQRHANYQEKAHLSGMEEHLAHLAQSWQTASAADPNKQSDLLGLGPALAQLENSWNELERDTRRATEVVEQIRAQQERCAASLEDEAFGELPGLAQLEDLEWAPVAGPLLEQHRRLAERTAHGDEDFQMIFNEAATLQKASQKLIKEYQFRLARTQIELEQLVQALNPLADQLDGLVQHATLEFNEQTVGLLNDLRIWLGQAQTQAGLDRRTALLAQGGQLRIEAEMFCRSLQAERSAAEQDRAWTEDMLATAEEYQGVTRQRLGANTFNGELASARNVLEIARRKLAAISTPGRKFTPEKYQAELADVRQMIGSARAHIDEAQG